MAEPLTDKGGEETGVPGENAGEELQKMPYTKARRFKPQARLEPKREKEKKKKKKNPKHTHTHTHTKPNKRTPH